LIVEFFNCLCVFCDEVVCGTLWLYHQYSLNFSPTMDLLILLRLCFLEDVSDLPDVLFLRFSEDALLS